MRRPDVDTMIMWAYVIVYVGGLAFALVWFVWGD